MWTTRRLGVAGENYNGSDYVNPVIGLDVSKGVSHAQAFADRGTPYGKIFRFNHDLDGLASFLRYAQDLESFTGKRAEGVKKSFVIQANDICF
jgi:hypothetical protein